MAASTANSRKKKKNPTCVFTSIYNDAGQNILNISEKYISAYARKISADFKIFFDYEQNIDMSFSIFLNYCTELMNNYDRIIFIDPDIIVMPECPDLTSIFSNEYFGAYFESEEESRARYIASGKLIYGDLPHWVSDYCNSGVLAFSPSHRALFVPPQKYLVADLQFQTLLNWRLNEMRPPIFKLDQRFNFIPALFGGIRSDAHMVHFAGPGRLLGRVAPTQGRMDALFEKISSTGETIIDRRENAAHLALKVYQMRDLAKLLETGRSALTIGSACFASQPQVGQFVDARGMVFARIPDLRLESAIFGPYISLLPGKYRISAEINCAHETKDVPIEFDILSNAGRFPVLSRKRLTLDDLIAGLEFPILSFCDDVEFRVHIFGKGFDFFAFQLEGIQ